MKENPWEIYANCADCFDRSVLFSYEVPSLSLPLSCSNHRQYQNLQLNRNSNIIKKNQEILLLSFRRIRGTLLSWQCAHRIRICNAFQLMLAHLMPTNALFVCVRLYICTLTIIRFVSFL